MRPCLVIGALLLAGSALTAVVPELPNKLLPPSVDRPEKHQLDGAVQTLTVGWPRSAGSVAAQVVEITHDVTEEDWSNEVERKRRRRDAGQPRRQTGHQPIDRYDGPVQDGYERYQGASQNEFLPEDIEEVRYSAPETANPSDPHQSVTEYSPYHLFPESFHDLLDIPIHVYKNGTEVRTHERPAQRPRQPTVSGGYANTNLQGYGAGRPSQSPPRAAATATTRRTTTTTRRTTTSSPTTTPRHHTRRPSVTKPVQFVTTTPRAKIVTPGSGAFGARAPADRRRPVTVQPSHELPDRVSALGFGFGGAGGGEVESQPEPTRAPLHQQLAFGRRPLKTRKRVPYIPRPSSTEEKPRPANEWPRTDDDLEDDRTDRNDEQHDATGAFSNYFAASTNAGAGFSDFGKRKDSADTFTTTSTTTTTTTITTTGRPADQTREVYHVTPSAVEPPSWQKWTSPRPATEHKKSHKKPVFKKPLFQEDNLQQNVGFQEPTVFTLQHESDKAPSITQQPPFQQHEEDHFSEQQKQQQQQDHLFQQQQQGQQQGKQQQQGDQFSQQQPKPFSQQVDPFAEFQDPFSQHQGPSFSSPQEPSFSQQQQQFQQQQFQPVVPDRDTSISVTSGPNLQSGPGSGIQQLAGPSFGGSPAGPGPRPGPPRPFGRPPRPQRPGRPQRPPPGDRPITSQNRRPAPPAGNRPVLGFAGRPPAPVDSRPVTAVDERPGSRPRRPPPTKKPSGGYLGSFLSWFRGGGDDEERSPATQDARPRPPTRQGPLGARPQEPRPRPFANRPGEPDRASVAPQGFPASFGGGPSVPFTPPPPPRLQPGRSPDGTPGLERAPGSFVRRDHLATSSGTSAHPEDTPSVLPQFRPGAAGAPRLAQRRRGAVQRRRGPPASARLTAVQALQKKASKPSGALPERAPESADVVLAAPARRRRPLRPRPAAQPPARRRAGGRPGADDARLSVGQPTARPATLLNEKRIVVVGPFGAPPPGAPYIQHPDQVRAAAAQTEGTARSGFQERRTPSGGGKGDGVTKKQAVTIRRVVAGSSSVADGGDAKPSISRTMPDGTTAGATPSTTTEVTTHSVVKDTTDHNPAQFRLPEMYSGFKPILN